MYIYIYISYIMAYYTMILYTIRYVRPVGPVA